MSNVFDFLSGISLPLSLSPAPLLSADLRREFLSQSKRDESRKKDWQKKKNAHTKRTQKKWKWQNSISFLLKYPWAHEWNKLFLVTSRFLSFSPLFLACLRVENGKIEVNNVRWCASDLAMSKFKILRAEKGRQKRRRRTEKWIKMETIQNENDKIMAE